MICSVQNSGGKSTSGWLDRLRSSKGITAGNDVDLDHFITHYNQNDDVADPVPPNPAPAPPETAGKIHREDIPGGSQEKDSMFNIMSNVLSELFVMGGGGGFPKSKCPRKQQNPKLCGSVSSPAFSCVNNSSNNSNGRSDGRKGSAAVAAAGSPASEGNNSTVGFVKLVENVNEEGHDEKGWNGLSGFSRTEVTVIDTSFANWKFEKMLFRRKNVWRVRDKKGKGGHFAMKKKKRKANDLVATDDGAKKSKEEYQQSNKSQTTSATASANFGNTMKKKHVALNSDKGSSSVILIKNIPADKKGSICIPRSCPKSTQKQLKI